MTGQHPSAADIVEDVLKASRSDGCIVLVDDASTANLRWANNGLTTNGVTQSRQVTVIAVVGEGDDAATGMVSRSVAGMGDVGDLVAEAEATARHIGAAPDAAPLAAPVVDDGWDAPAADPIGVDALAAVADGLAEALAAARVERRVLAGYAEHAVTTTTLGTSTGVRRRHEQPSGHIGVTARTPGGEASAWVGQATRDFTDVSVRQLDADLRQRLAWSQRRVDAPAGRYDTVLPPTAVADLMIYAYWEMGALDAADGRTAYGEPGRGTRVGQPVAGPGVTLRSDPAFPGLACAPFVLAHASSSMTSVFDNGLPVGPTAWIKDGVLRHLVATRSGAARTGLSPAPFVGNLVLDVAGGSGGVHDLVRDVDRGLLLTCLWYIREVDPQTLLLTGLTRDGVFLVEGGEVVGAVNNFRFNESPLSLLQRVSAASSTGPAFSREWGDYFPRTAMPALRVGDFHMSSVSQAS
jgi:predicted Zn-dependent protease